MIKGICGIAGLAILGGIISAFFGVAVIVSFEVAFFGFLLVVLGSFSGIYRRVQAEKLTLADSVQDSQSRTCNLNESNSQDKQGSPQQKTFISKFILGTQMSFSLLRIFSYILLIGGILLLIKYHLWHTLGFFAGLSLSVLTLVGIGISVMSKWQKSV